MLLDYISENGRSGQQAPMWLYSALEWTLHQGDELVPRPGVILSFHFLIIGRHNICSVMVHIVHPKDALSKKILYILSQK